jgi:hypothetical protein
MAAVNRPSATANAPRPLLIIDRRIIMVVLL